MHHPSTGTTARTPGPGSWTALTASERGASHIAASIVNQDSIAVAATSSGGVVAAVADGHGHRRHMRSARGSAIAARVACDAGRDLAAQIDGAPERFGTAREAPADARERISSLVSRVTIPSVVQHWREAVLADLAADPFTDAEQEQRPRGDDPVIAYGSTLILAVTAGRWLILTQVGDGDVVVVDASGGGSRPVPDDPQLDGQATTSLCSRDATADFRHAVVDVRATPPVSVLLATDGYGNAQIARDWPSAFGRDLAVLLREHDTQWMAEQLPGWAARCASADGSADDTSVALLIFQPDTSARPFTPPGGMAASTVIDSGSEEPTIPAGAGS